VGVWDVTVDVESGATCCGAPMVTQVPAPTQFWLPVQGVPG
jgi:hypothetical protein